MKKIAVSGLLYFTIAAANAQTPKDTTKQLNEVEVNAYADRQPLMQSPSTVSIIDSKKLSEWNDYSLVPAINSAPGVRMEERSPGSFRLSIRGSLIRSPFGIRNIKTYLGDFPLTDAGGNTYINMLDPGTISRIEILKGPEASVFGANSGGVILIDPVTSNSDSSFASAGMNIGSYGSLHQKVILQKSFDKYRINVAQGFQRSNGYRDNSESKRHYIHLYQQWNYLPKAQLKAFVLFSDLTYRTPGGLTLEQFRTTPTAARYPAATLPGASEQKAGVYNQTIFGGVAQEIYFLSRFRHSIAVFGSHTNFENPFITNYEVRTENTTGIRTFLEVSTKPSYPVVVRWQSGIEAQRSGSDIRNFGNNSGTKDSIQASDDIVASQHFYFTRFHTRFRKRLTLEVALSLNYYNYQYRSQLQSLKLPYNKTTFDPQFMPRAALAYNINPTFSWRASVSRGYSAPAISEVRPSDNILYADLQPENGWNYETGVRYEDRRNIISLDAAVFYYRLQSAIVRRTTEAGTEYFVNAGGTRQWGVETQISIWIVKARNYSLLRGLQLWNSYTFNHFLFNSYTDATADYSGNNLTGVPAHVNVAGISVQLPLAFYLFTQYNYTARLPLNDQNSVYAEDYHLVQLKGGWKKKFSKVILELFAGIDNLLDQSYSLGNDLNAAGGRYYNPAPLRNYYSGFTVLF